MMPNENIKLFTEHLHIAPLSMSQGKGLFHHRLKGQGDGRGAPAATHWYSVSPPLYLLPLGIQLSTLLPLQTTPKQGWLKIPLSSPYSSYSQLSLLFNGKLPQHCSDANTGCSGGVSPTQSCINLTDLTSYCQTDTKATPIEIGMKGPPLEFSSKKY